MPRIPPDILSELDKLLDEALDLPAEERRAWLTRLRHDRPIHADEIGRMLASEAMLDKRAYLSPASLPAPPTAEPGLAGQRFGPWMLERALGQGGMGTVWLARRTDGRFEGTAAVKLLHLSLLDRVGIERFRREGSVLARLSHPHIARLLDAGVTAEGQPYLVLEQVEGERIDRYCDARRLPPEARLRLFLDVLAAVAHAHANLIVHRDLKPSNILVTSDGVVKLLDFGIAKLLSDEGRSADTTLTDLGGRAMTPEYAAPEQVTGGPITIGTDIYALGVLLYLLLSGRHPTGEGGRTPAEYLRAIVDVEPRRLSADVTGAEARGSSRERLRRLYAGDLGTIVAKALRKRPDERYGSVGAFADDLGRYLRHEPVQARPDSWGYRARKFLRRYRGPVAAGVTVAAALLAALGIAWRQTQVARAQRDEALYQSHRAEAIGDFQTAILSQIGVSRLSLSDLLAQNVTLLARRPPADPRLHTAFLLQLAERYGDLERRTEQRGLVGTADSVARRSADSELRAATACALANYHVDQRETDSAVAWLDAARRHLAKVERPAVATQVACLRPAGELAYVHEHYDSAAALLGHAAALLDSAGAGGTLRYFSIESARADHLRAGGRVREAIELGRSTKRGLEDLGLGGSTLAILANGNLVTILSEVGERQEALAISREVLTQLHQADPAAGAHPVIGFNHATELALSDIPDSARAWYEAVAASARAKALAEVERRALMGVARTSARLGDVPTARRAFRRMLLLAHQQGRPVERESLFVTASIAAAEGDTGKALAGFRAVLERDGFPDASLRRRSRAPLLDLTRLTLAQGRYDESLGLARLLRGVDLVDSLAATRSGAVGQADLLLARAHLGMGRADSGALYARAAARALEAGLGPANPLTREANALLATLDR
jgi:serine/threonine protein kinase